MILFIFLSTLFPSFNLIFIDAIQTGIKSSTFFNLCLIFWSIYVCKISANIFNIASLIFLIIIILYITNNKILAITITRYLELGGVFFAGYTITRKYHVKIAKITRIIFIPLISIIILDIFDINILYYENLVGGWQKGIISGPFALNYQLGLAMGSLAMVGANQNYPPGLRRGMIYLVIGMLIYLITLSRATFLGFILICLLNIVKFKWSRTILIVLSSFLVFLLIYDLSIIKNINQDVSLAFRFRLWECLYTSFNSTLFGNADHVVFNSNSCVDSQSLSTESLQIRIFFYHGIFGLFILLILIWRWIKIFQNQIKTENAKPPNLRIYNFLIPLEFMIFGIAYSIFIDGLITAHAGSIYWLLFGSSLGACANQR